jgi:transposase
LPAQGVLLFLDVKPVSVKAYGGRRYSSEASLVLPRQQKTRGRFYVFAAYEVNAGRVRWAFLKSKSSPDVIRFLQQIRRWYPDQDVWVVLDQDRAHPCKSRATRQAMRTLKLHWVSLPKGSPDDNPVETLFSDVQLMILDNSNDPDAAATQRRISAHWRRRNQRSDRHIRISYLGDSDEQ